MTKRYLEIEIGCCSVCYYYNNAAEDFAVCEHKQGPTIIIDEFEIHPDCPLEEVKDE